MRRTAGIILGVCLLAGCASPGTPSAYPSGWTPGKNATTYVSAGQTFELKKAPFGGTIKDFASQLTTNTVLTNRTAKFVRSIPYPDCPGEAALQTFAIGGKAPRSLEIGFTVTGNLAITASYSRPKSMAEDPQARAAMRKDVCTVVI